ncbi:cold-shock protein [Streptomyces lydicus]|uniref:cold-shock protein n=1 Tax=Streptomyces lydicus TaxID=47763 RepID=UPI0037BBF1A5
MFDLGVKAIFGRQVSHLHVELTFNTQGDLDRRNTQKGPDLSVHSQAIEGDGFNSLKEGQAASFEAVQGQKAMPARSIRPRIGLAERVLPLERADQHRVQVVEQEQDHAVLGYDFCQRRRIDGVLAGDAPRARFRGGEGFTARRAWGDGPQQRVPGDRDRLLFPAIAGMAPPRTSS